jgi:tetratricopeptide (TPR) repeat protein
VACALYVNTLAGDLVWDDLELFKTQPLVGSPGSVVEIFGSPYWGAGDYLYRPLTVWSLALNGTSPVGLHLVNVILNAAVCCALYGFLRRISLSVWPSFAAALLFAAHPIHTEAVAQIVNRSDLLATLFGLLFLSLHVRRGPLAAGAVCFLLALWSKESAIVLLPLAVWTDACFPNARRRWWWGGYAVSALVGLGWFGMRAAALGSSPEGVPFVDNPLVFASTTTRILTAGAIQLDYLRLLLWPVGLSADYSFDQIPAATSWTEPGFLGFATVLLAAAVTAWLVRRSHRIVAYAIVGYAVAFSLTGNFLLPIGTIMGERLAYLPSVFAILAVAYGAWLLRERFGHAVTAALCVVLLLLGGLTFARNRTWADRETFSRTLVDSAPESAKSYYTLAVVQHDSGALEEALESCERAISIHSRYAEAWSRMGMIHGQRGDYAAAAEVYGMATSIFPGYVEAHYGLAHSYQMIDQLVMAAESYRTALSLDPGLVQAYTNLGSIYARLGRFDEAEKMWTEALVIDPEHSTAKENLERLHALERK